MFTSLSRRDTLLSHNAGIWDGTFIRLDGTGRELERFGSHLEVVDKQGTVHADLTNGNTGAVRSMQFSEPPAEMQITPAGHWSLGPDRIGPWPWVCELCLVWGDRRRRVVVRHNSEGLESLVIVCEGRPDQNDDSPPTTLQLTPQPLSLHQHCWSLAAPAAMAVTTMASRRQGEVESVCLQWQPEAGVQLQLTRSYGIHGLLEPV